jgi:C4-dicarboxylate transporter DctM subunit
VPLMRFDRVWTRVESRLAAWLLVSEIAYCCPPLGLNLFISSFRFNRPVVTLYRVVLPFIGILAGALALVSYVPLLSNVLVRGDIALARAGAAKEGGPPREAWRLECVQENPSDPLPCSPADKEAYRDAGSSVWPSHSNDASDEALHTGTPSENALDTEEDILRQMGVAPKK